MVTQDELEDDLGPLEVRRPGYEAVRLKGQFKGADQWPTLRHGREKGGDLRAAVHTADEAAFREKSIRF